MGLNSISKKMGKSKLEAKPVDTSKEEYYDPAKDTGASSSVIDQPKTLADRFAGDKNLIRLTPAQKKMYRKEGYSDVNDYKTILAPGTVFRPGYKPMYDSDKSTDKPKMESGIGTAESGTGVASPGVTINGKKLWSGDWASQNPDVKPSVNSKSKGKGKFVAPVSSVPLVNKVPGATDVQNNPNPTVKAPVKSSITAEQKTSRIDAIKQYHEAVSSMNDFTPELKASSEARIAAAKKKLEDMKIDMNEVMSNSFNNNPIPSANEVNKGFHPINWLKSKMQYAMDETNKFNRGEPVPSQGIYSKSRNPRLVKTELKQEKVAAVAKTKKPKFEY